MIVKDLQAFCTGLTKGSPIIAIDYGKRKIGIAISDPTHSFALPLKNIDDVVDSNKIKQIKLLIDKYSCSAIVMGLPIAMDGSFTEQTEVTLNFATKLAKSISCSIYLQDERLTSRAADNLLKSFGIKRKVRNTIDDSVAANIILQDTLNLITKIKSNS